MPSKISKRETSLRFARTADDEAESALELIRSPIPEVREAARNAIYEAFRVAYATRQLWSAQEVRDIVAQVAKFIEKGKR